MRPSPEAHGSDQVVEVRGMSLARAAESIVEIASDQGYTVAAAGPNRFELRRARRPMWANVGALVLAPVLGIGLLFLLVKRVETCEAIVLEDRAGVRINLVGLDNPRLFLALHTVLNEQAPPVYASPRPTAFVPPDPSQAPAGGGLPAPLRQSPTEVTAAAAPAPIAFDKTLTIAQLQAMRSTAAPILQLPDGTLLPVDAGLVLGRNPEADPDLPSATLVRLPDPSLSKTHASFGPTARGIWVQDHRSTNGTTVTVRDSTTVCQPGARVEVPVGASVTIGDVVLLVTASPT